MHHLSCLGRGGWTSHQSLCVTAVALKLWESKWLSSLKMSPQTSCSPAVYWEGRKLHHWVSLIFLVSFTHIEMKTKCLMLQDYSPHVNSCWRSVCILNHVPRVICMFCNMTEMHFVEACPCKTDFINQKWSLCSFLCIDSWQDKLRTLILSASGAAQWQRFALGCSTTLTLPA